MNCGIYCITNTINGKKYIGQSSNLTQRFKKYKQNQFSNQHITNAVKKYGWDEFTLNVLVYCEENDLDYYETNLIESMDLRNRVKGYNKLTGGSDNKKHSEDTKLRISDKKKGVLLTQQHKNNISKATRGDKNPFYGKSHSKELIKQIAEKIRKPIISEDCSLFFLTNSDAYKAGYHNAQAVANGKRKFCKGIVFRFATEEEINLHLKGMV